MAKDRAEQIRRVSELLSDDLHEHRREENLRGADRGVAAVLSILACLQIGLFTALSVYPAVAAKLSLQPHPGFLPYVVALGCFAPLALRRRWPVPVLIVTSAFAALYFAMPWPPTIVVAGPMLALYTVASRYGGRRAIPVGVVLFGMLLGVSALTVSVSYTVAQAVGMFALLALAAALGHGARTRTELFAEVRRTREEEALRRLEEERLRIAREVHDIMAHSLTLMTVQADAGLAVVGDGTGRAADALGIIGDTGRATLRDLRSMLSVLTGGEDGSPREPVADLTALGRLVDSVREAGFDASLATDGDLASVPTAIAVSAYRIVQESLTNVVRHSRARSVTVRVAAMPSELSVEVADDGTGRGGPREGGRGIRGMRERVDVLGGTLEAGPAPERGFRVSARIPLPRSA
jgi:signal transduction histidine kinase